VADPKTGHGLPVLPRPVTNAAAMSRSASPSQQFSLWEWIAEIPLALPWTRSPGLKADVRSSGLVNARSPLEWTIAMSPEINFRAVEVGSLSSEGKMRIAVLKENPLTLAQKYSS